MIDIEDFIKDFVSSVVKCMVFPTNIMTKPILSHQVYQGTLFELVDAAKSFVMQHIDAKVGTRKNSNSVDIEYEIPIEAVAEAIVNACVHRSYESTGSVQVMLFKDRLEVWNPGTLPCWSTEYMMMWLKYWYYPPLGTIDRLH